MLNAVSPVYHRTYTSQYILWIITARLDSSKAHSFASIRKREVASRNGKEEIADAEREGRYFGSRREDVAAMIGIKMRSGYSRVDEVNEGVVYED